MPLIDVKTGRKICRVWVLPWRGRLRVFGIPDYLPVRLNLEAREELTVQSTVIGATMVAPPDYPSIGGENEGR